MSQTKPDEKADVMSTKKETTTLLQIDLFRRGKAYSVAQAGRLARTSAPNVRRWLLGYEAPGHRMEPVFGSKDPQASPLAVSFLELTELIVVARFRQGEVSGRPIKLSRLRDAHEFARRELGLPYPFATLKLREFGGHILHTFETAHPGPGHLALDLHGNYVLPHFVEEELDLFDFEDEFASRWFPAGRERRIVVDPRLAGGQPTILGTGVTADIVRRRFEAGEKMDTLADDFDLEIADVEEAIRFAA